MPDNRSIYTLNKKDAEAIVYTEKNSRVIRITRESVEAGCDFEQLKAWSDEDYHAAEKMDHIESNHTVPLETILESLLPVESAEEVLERQFDRREKQRRSSELLQTLRTSLSETQYRRAWLYYGRRMTEERIAVLEGSTQQAVSKSLKQAKEKMKNFLEEAKKGL